MLTQPEREEGRCPYGHQRRGSRCWGPVPRAQMKNAPTRNPKPATRLHDFAYEQSGMEEDLSFRLAAREQDQPPHLPKRGKHPVQKPAMAVTQHTHRTSVSHPPAWPPAMLTHTHPSAVPLGGLRWGGLGGVGVPPQSLPIPPAGVRAPLLVTIRALAPAPRRRPRRRRIPALPLDPLALCGRLRWRCRLDRCHGPVRNNDSG